jgi:hypothetical protein
VGFAEHSREVGRAAGNVQPATQSRDSFVTGWFGDILPGGSGVGECATVTVPKERGGVVRCSSRLLVGKAKPQ